MKEINENIKKLRTKRKVSQERMAELLEKSRTAYTKQEKNGEFSASEILKILDFFKVKAGDIFGEDETFFAVLNDSGKNEKQIENLTPFTATNSEQELILALRQLPKSRLHEILKSVKEESDS